MSEEIVAGCPFCGEPPTVKKLQGCGDKHLVACKTATCPLAPTVIGATLADAIRRWTTRDAKTQDVTFAMLYSLADSCKLLVATIEQINGTCQTREQRIALAVGRAVLAELQRLEHADHAERDGDTTTREGEQ